MEQIHIWIFLFILAMMAGVHAAEDQVVVEEGDTTCFVEEDDSCSNEQGPTETASATTAASDSSTFEAPTAAATKEISTNCRDADKACGYLAGEGECEENFTFMNIYCRRACGLCQPPEELAGGVDLGVLQRYADPTGITVYQIEHQMDRAREYVENVARCQPAIWKSQNLATTCKNKHEACTIWSLKGECHKNPGYMRLYCGPVCQACHFTGDPTVDKEMGDLNCPVNPVLF